MDRRATKWRVRVIGPARIRVHSGTIESIGAGQSSLCHGRKSRVRLLSGAGQVGRGVGKARVARELASGEAVRAAGGAWGFLLRQPMGAGGGEESSFSGRFRWLPEEDSNLRPGG